VASEAEGRAKQGSAGIRRGGKPRHFGVAGEADGRAGREARAHAAGGTEPVHFAPNALCRHRGAKKKNPSKEGFVL